MAEAREQQHIMIVQVAIALKADQDKELLKQQTTMVVAAQLEHR